MLVSVRELERYMQREFDEIEKQSVEYILQGVQGEIEAFIHRPIEVGSYVERHVIPWDKTSTPMGSFFYDLALGETTDYQSLQVPPVTVYLKNTPVVSVALVTLRARDGATAASLTVEEEYLVQEYGVDVYGAGANDEVWVHYTGGIDGPNLPYFRGLILKAATRIAQNMYDEAFSPKDLSARDAVPVDTSLMESELRTLQYYKKKRIASR